MGQGFGRVLEIDDRLDERARTIWTAGARHVVFCCCFVCVLMDGCWLGFGGLKLFQREKFVILVDFIRKVMILYIVNMNVQYWYLF